MEIQDIDDICFINNYEEIYALQNRIEYRKCVGNLKAMKIYVYSNEGENIPHFHISKVDKTDCCLKILKPEWFIHGKNNGTISKKELKLLYEWLNKDNRFYWKEIINEWNKQRNNKVDCEIEVPKYDDFL